MLAILCPETKILWQQKRKEATSAKQISIFQRDGSQINILTEKYATTQSVTEMSTRVERLPVRRFNNSATFM